MKTKQKWKYYDFIGAINCTHKLTCVCACTCACDYTLLREPYANMMPRFLKSLEKLVPSVCIF